MRSRRRWPAFRNAVLGATCFLQSLMAQDGAAEPAVTDSAVATQDTRLDLNFPEDCMLLVGQLDGVLKGIDAVTGEMIWQFDSGSPLVSSHTPDALSRGHVSSPTFFPGADGGLYHYNGDEGKLEKLPLSVVDLAEQSPSITGDGSPVLGDRSSTVYYLHRRTGQLLSTFNSSPSDKSNGRNLNLGSNSGASTVGGSSSASDSPHQGGGGGVNPGGDSGNPGEPGQVSLWNMHAEDVVALGRVTYLVEAKHALTRETLWNMTFARWQHMPLPGGMFEEASLLDVGEGQYGALDAGHSDVPLIAGQPLGLHLSHNKISRLTSSYSEVWSHDFPAAPVFVVASRPVEYYDDRLAPTGDPYVTPDNSEVSSGALMRTSGGVAPVTTPAITRECTRGEEGHGQTVVVGSMHGSLYALPVASGSLGDRGGAGGAATWETAADADNFGGVQGEDSENYGAYANTNLDAIFSGDEDEVVTVVSEDVHSGVGTFMCPLGTMDAPPAAVVPPWLPQPQITPLPPLALDPPYQPEHVNDHHSPSITGVMVALAAVSVALVWSLWTRWMRPSTHGQATGDQAQADTQPQPQGRLREHPDGTREIGNLSISPTVLGYGSSTHGTVVFAGDFGGRPVAVKRLLVQFHDVALKEVDAFIASDEHPNVLRCFAWERAGDFVYLALERCTRSLYDAVLVPPPSYSSDLDEELPEPYLWQICQDMIQGVHALHAKGIVHRDIKPQNVLLTASNRAKVSDMGLSKTIEPHMSSFDSLGGSGSSGWQAPEQIRTLATPNTPKASTPKAGFAESPRRVLGDVREGSSPGSSPTAKYTSQLSARRNGLTVDSNSNSVSGSPRKRTEHEFEFQLRKRGSDAGSGVSSARGALPTPTPSRQSKATDIFSLGLVLYWTLTRGEHPFGNDRYVRDSRILKDSPDLSAISHMPELQNLLEAMLQRDPRKRPDTAAVLAHPVWWSSQRKLAFVLDVSDRFETCDREAESSPILQSLEATASCVFPPGANWATKLEPNLLANLNQYRRYKYGSVRDLLRVIRNKANHFRELPEDLQKLLGEPPSDYYVYFSERFPNLLLTMMFFVIATGAQSESQFSKYEVADVDFSKFQAVHTTNAKASLGISTVLGVSASPTPRDTPRDAVDSSEAAACCTFAAAATSAAGNPDGGTASNVSSDRTLPATPMTAKAGKLANVTVRGTGMHSESPRAPVDASKSGPSLSQGVQKSAQMAVPASPMQAKTPNSSSSAKRKGHHRRVSSSGGSPEGDFSSYSRPPSGQGQAPMAPGQIPMYMVPVNMHGQPHMPQMMHAPTPPMTAPPPNGADTSHVMSRSPPRQGVQPPAPPGLPPPAPGANASTMPPASMQFMHHNRGLSPVHTSATPSTPHVPHPPSQPPPQQGGTHQPSQGGAPQPGGNSNNNLPPADQAPFHVGWTDSGSDAGSFSKFPRNPGAQLCEYYVRTGHCKYGNTCFKDHPEQYAVKLNLLGLPLRPGVQACPFFMQHANCEFGAACKFHHPNLEPAYAAGAGPQSPP